MAAEDEIKHPNAAVVRFELKGETRGGDDNVPFDAFLEFAEGVLETLKRIERSATGVRKSLVDYRIVELEIGSANVAVEIPPIENHFALPSRIATTFAKGAAALRDNTLDALQFDGDTLAGFKRMAAALHKGIRSAVVEADGVRIDLGVSPAKMLQLSPATHSASVGSLTGHIDALNVHRDYVFYLYPVVGPTRIPCMFDRPLLPKVSAAVKRYTTVSGLIEYATGSFFPARIVVDDVVVHPPDDELPTLASLWGIAPEITQGLDSVAYLKRIRNAG